MTDKKIAGVIVTFNRKYELLKNLKMCLSQSRPFDKIYIIDNNGTDMSYQYIKDNIEFDENVIDYIYLNENLGGAGGFYTGMKKAFEEGYDFVCLMDDDGRPINNNTIAFLYNAAVKIYENNNKIMINSLVVSDDETLSFPLNEIFLVKEAINQSNNNILIGVGSPFNATIISRELIVEIGYPNKDFFIRGDEIDYIERSRRANAYIATVVNSIYYHPKEELLSYNFFGRKKDVIIAAPWKMYYAIRNTTYRLKRDYGLLRALRFDVGITISIVKCYKNRNEYYSCIKYAISDGLKGNLGKKDII